MRRRFLASYSLRLEARDVKETLRCVECRYRQAVTSVIVMEAASLEGKCPEGAILYVHGRLSLHPEKSPRGLILMLPYRIMGTP